MHGRTHQPVMLWITASCLLIKGRWSHLKNTWAVVDIWQASETSHSKKSLGNIQHQYLAELLVNEYSYCLMVKRASCCCMHWSWLFSDLVPFAYTHHVLDPLLLLILILPTQNDKSVKALFTRNVWKNIALRVRPYVKYSARLCLVLYLPLDPTLRIAFSVHHS